jgi:hypothetical protein
MEKFAFKWFLYLDLLRPTCREKVWMRVTLTLILSLLKGEENQGSYL